MTGRGLRIEGLRVRLPGQSAAVLRSVDLEVRPGEIVGVCGRSGCGKSTLLAAISGLVPWSRRGEVQGVVELDGEAIADLDPGQRAHLFATCLDCPEAQLFLATPRQELAAVRQLRKPAPHLDSVVAALAVGPLLNRRIGELSSGERQRVALAVALAAAPRPVLLDEPTAHLDADGVAALRAGLDEVARAGGAVLLVEQSGWRLGRSVHRWLTLNSGTLVTCEPPAGPLVPRFLEPREGAAMLSASDLTVRRNGRTLVAGSALELRPGEVVTLGGANGSGKSTLARVLAGHTPPGVETSGSVEREGAVAIMLPAVELQLFADSVAGELALAGADAATIGRRLAEHHLASFGGCAPWSLSHGEQQRLLHAALDALEPRVLILDEPAQGLDPGDLLEFAETLRVRASAGRATLIVTQREELAAAASRVLRMEGGRIAETARPR